MAKVSNMGIWKQLIGEEPDIFEKITHLIKNGNNSGEFGEWLTQYALKTIDGNYFLLKNVYIPYKGKTSEIDLLLVHERGIYVFESKNYSGWIFGSIDNKYWTQSLNRNKKNRFYNPVLQNRTHIKALVEYLKIPNEHPPKSYIVFSERCELKKTPENTDTLKICKRNTMLRILQRDLENSLTIYDQSTLTRYKAILEKHTNISETEKRKHIIEVKRSRG